MELSRAVNTNIKATNQLKQNECVPHSELIHLLVKRRKEATQVDINAPFIPQQIETHLSVKHAELATHSFTFDNLTECT